MIKKSITNEIKPLDIKFAKRALLPHNFIGMTGPDERYSIRDGQTVKFEYIGTWDNSDGRYDKELSEISNRLYAVNISRLSEIWEQKINTKSTVWHEVKMVLINR
jgi:hypothetical protein